MSEWRDMSRIPRGMSDFKRWYRPPGIDSRKSPSDIDGILHTLNGNRFLMFEFKPEGASLTTGQRITMTGFSKLEGCTALAIYDPYWNDTSRTKYDDQQLLTLQVFRNGKSSWEEATVEELNQLIAEWFEDV